MTDKNTNQRLDSAIDQLRTETVPAAAAHRVLNASQHRHPKRAWTPALAGGVALTALVAMALWPSSKAMAWQEVVQKNLDIPRVHEVTFELLPKSGEWSKTSEAWYDGDKLAIAAPATRGSNYFTQAFDFRYDGKRRYRIGWEGYGMVETVRFSHMRASVDRFSVKKVLSNKEYVVKGSPEQTKLDGKDALIYRVEMASKSPNIRPYRGFRFYADRESGRLLRTDCLDTKGELAAYVLNDYPDSIAASRFEPPKSGIRVYDIDQDRARLKEQMAHGVPIGHGNVLRALIQSPTGDLLVLWTGIPPNGDGSTNPSVVGHPTKAFYASDYLTVSRWKVPQKSWPKFNGQPICGMNLRLKSPVRDFADVSIPVLEENSAAPIRDAHGKLVAYRSRASGTRKVARFPVLDSLPMNTLISMSQK